jgi:hypothetical protein
MLEHDGALRVLHVLLSLTPGRQRERHPCCCTGMADSVRILAIWAPLIQILAAIEESCPGWLMRGRPAHYSQEQSSAPA